MTKKATYIFIVIIAVIVWMLLQNNQDKIKPVQLVSQKTSNTTEITPKTPDPIAKAVHIEAEIQTNEAISQPTVNKLAELTYMQLYEKYLDAKDCSEFYSMAKDPTSGHDEIYTETDNNTLYIQQFKDNISRNSKDRQAQATEHQLEYYQEYIDQCIALKSQVENYTDASDEEMDSVYYTLNQISSIMNEAKPLTKEGKQLKSVLSKSKIYRNQISKIIKLNGNSNLSEIEIRELNQKLRNLEFNLLNNSFYGAEAKQSTEYITLKKEYNETKSFIDSNQNIDNQEVNKQIQVLINSIAKLQMHLNTKYPSVFRETFNALNHTYDKDNQLPYPLRLEHLKKTGVEVPVISQQIFEQSEIKDKRYFNIILQPSLDFYLCSLGEDCNLHNSRRLAQLCFIPPDRFFEQIQGIFYEACEMNLEEFYTKKYFTENQFQDMNVIFNYLVNNYAN